MNDVECKQKRILYYGAGWPTNIGNAFIDLGAMAILKAATPKAEVAFASEMPRWFFQHSTSSSSLISKAFSSLRNLTHKLQKPVNGSTHVENAFDVGAVTDCDLVAFSGMAMCEEFVHVNGPTIAELSRRGIPVLLLGTGALNYNDLEREIFGRFVKQIHPIGFISRDNKSFEMFADFFQDAWKGIDCGFFLPEAYKPFPIKMAPYIVATFDTMPEPMLDLNGKVLVRAHHEFWGPSPTKYVSEKLTLISDIPYDYLTLYANAEEIHSDRVHTCVAALAYGRPVKFYHPTLRGSLFEAVGAYGIRDRLTKIDAQVFAEKKKQQIEYVKELIESHVK